MIEILQGMGLLLGFGAILFLAYVTTRFIADKSSNSMKGKYINIVDTINLGMDKRLYLIKVGDRYALIASTGKSIEFLTDVKLEETDLGLSKQNEIGAFSFSGFLDKYLQGYKDKKIVKTPESNNEKAVYSLRGNALKKNLGKLRELTSQIGRDSIKNGDDITNEK